MSAEENTRLAQIAKLKVVTKANHRGKASFLFATFASVSRTSRLTSLRNYSY